MHWKPKVEEIHNGLLQDVVVAQRLECSQKQQALHVLFKPTVPDTLRFSFLLKSDWRVPFSWPWKGCACVLCIRR
eukprot:5601335-Prorocentrum_lima.AAC.1